MKRNLGDILVTAGVINTQQLHECTEAITGTGMSLEHCLLSKKYTTTQDIAKAYAQYASMEYVDAITESMADLTLLAKVPLKFLRENTVMPVMINGQLTILTANPLHFQPLDELNMLLGGGAQYAVAPQNTIIDAINRYYPLEGAKQMIEELEEEEKGLDEVAFEGIEEKDILAMATEAPIIKLVNHILYQAVKRDASDIHIEPFEKELRVRYRIDGIMYDVMTPPKRIQAALVSRIKIMANLNIAEKRIPQDGRIAIKVADKAFDIRVSVLPVEYGERIVMRLLDKSKSFTNLKDLDFSERDYRVVEDAIKKPNGIIYVTGPTGSGKTTTLYSVLTELNKPDVNIITVEDPVEYQMAGIGQVQVKDKVGLTFAAALRSILRQDPDIIMIGETRDQETAQIAVQAALTGHLVLSTLHTNSAPASITRLIDMGVEPFLLASSIELIMAQRLVRKLCDFCKKPYQPQPELLARIGISAEEAKKITFYEPVGCTECNETGYRGRIAIFEVMDMTEGIADLTMVRADTGKIREQAIKDGMTTLIQDGIRKIKQGLTTIDEVLSVAAIEHTVVE
ncbi:MAG TPA: type II secretion system ATPase GspE [Candidatus Dependentiae bacterium]|nr:type II secretion system ATPase GspE [Candidatus Dependentiae bacterium]HRQ62920.1 type II secretion system ATPase GspE [Candidatus Dependentiae bacterium]